jgi:hypothetical protein
LPNASKSIPILKGKNPLSIGKTGGEEKMTR